MRMSNSNVKLFGLCISRRVETSLFFPEKSCQMAVFLFYKYGYASLTS